MKIDIDDLDETYNKCLATGKFKEKNTIDTELIKSLKNVAEQGLKFIKVPSPALRESSQKISYVLKKLETF